MRKQANRGREDKRIGKKGGRATSSQADQNS